VSCGDYTVRVSHRARHARLKLSAREGLVVTIPHGFARERVPELLEAKRDWLRAAEERAAKQRELLGPPGWDLPERIPLRAIGEDWQVEYRGTAAAVVSAHERPERRLLIRGSIGDRDAARRAAQRWVARKTHDHVHPWLLRLADAHELRVDKVLVRAQRTRWASCSSRRTISLNLRLMFLPSDLVRYVLLHELAHTEEMSHSQRYWAILGTLSPDFRTLDEQLRQAWRLIPSWAR
jgi:predicted metal-dependent hydrolase